MTKSLMLIEYDLTESMFNSPAPVQFTESSSDDDETEVNNMGIQINADIKTGDLHLDNIA